MDKFKMKLLYNTEEISCTKTELLDLKVTLPLAKSRYYISLMDVAQNLMFIISYYIYFKLINDSIFNLMMLI